MADQERLIIRGQIAEHEERLEEIEHRVVNAARTVRMTLVNYDDPDTIDIAGLRAAVSDLDTLVTEYRTTKQLVAKLKERIGEE